MFLLFLAVASTPPCSLILPRCLLQPLAGEKSDAGMEADAARFRSMYQKLIMEQLKLRKWDSVTAVLDSMANAQGMAPSLSLLLTVLDVSRACVLLLVICATGLTCYFSAARKPPAFCIAKLAEKYAGEGLVPPRSVPYPHPHALVLAVRVQNVPLVRSII